MSEPRQANLFIVLALLAITMLPACALAPPSEIPPQTGRVLDEATQQPIEGAIVVLRWQGVGTKAFVDTQTVCYHVESAVTDANGRYTMTPWKEEFRYRDLSMKQVLGTVYKPGYRDVRMDRATGVRYLRRDTGSVKDRLEYLTRSGVDCDESGDDRKKLLSLYKLILDEASTIGVGQEDQKTVEILRFQFESLELGSVEALDRMIARRKERK